MPRIQNKQTADAEYDSNIETEIYGKSGDLFGRGRFSGRQCLKPFSRSAWPAYRQPGLADAFDDQGLSSLREDDGRHRRHSTRRSEEHTSELQSQSNLVCRLL